MGMMIRTKEGLILENLLHDCKSRWLFCWNGEVEGEGSYPYDCACCITWSSNELYQSCGCICHQRIEEMARVPHIKLWLLAAQAMNELPKFFTSYEEKLIYSKEQFAEHAAQRLDWSPESMRILGECKCEFCEFVRNDVNRKFPIEGQDNSHVCSDNEPEAALGTTPESPVL